MNWFSLCREHRPSSSSGKSKFTSWRTYQVHANMINQFLGYVCNPTIVSAWSSLMIAGVCTGLKLYHAIPLPIYASFALLGIDGFIATCTIVRTFGNVNGLSRKVLHSWKRINYGVSNKSRIQKKQLESCSELRIRLGGSNYIEQTTCLVTLDFCFDQIVRFLIAY